MVESKGFVKNPMKDPQGHFTKEQVNTIIIESEKESEKDHLFFTLLALSGRRISEVLLLKPADINWEEKSITWTILKKGYTIKKKKDKETKEITEIKEPVLVRKNKPVESGLLLLLKEYIIKNKIPRDEKIFPFSRFHINYVLNKICNKIGLKLLGSHRPHPHTFRHTFAMNLAKNVDSTEGLIKLRNIMEHSDINMTLHYVQATSEQTRELIEKSMSINDFDIHIPKETILVPIKQELEKKIEKPQKEEILVPFRDDD